MKGAIGPGMPIRFVSMSILVVCLFGCSAPADTATVESGWDSAGGNPTHATHTYLTEHALDSVESAHPEVAQHRADVIAGANLELHELPVSDPEQEALRIEAGGTNSGCDHPQVYWMHAVERFQAGDVAKAFWFVGILLHFVEDLGVPAHALGVWHESSPSTWDHFELLALQSWSSRFVDVERDDPWLANPSDYVAVSAAWAREDFAAEYPGVVYGRTFFSKTWVFASTHEKRFVGDREARTATVAAWALEAAAEGLEALGPAP